MDEMLRIWNLFVYAFKNAFDYKGRACRMEIISFTVMYAVLAFVIIAFQMGVMGLFAAFPRFALIKSILLSLFFGVTILFILAAGLMGISLSVRRMHDINYSGWWVLLIAVLQEVPIVKIFAALAGIYFYYIKKGDLAENKYGPVSVNF